MDVILLIGRILFGATFILSGIGHLKNRKETAQIAGAAGVPVPQLLTFISSLLALFGGLSLALGYHIEIGCVLLLLFLLPVTFIMHSFWTYADPNEAGNQQGHFMKNIALIGAALILLYSGPGPFSLG
ncbi:DoxX family protein [Paenibacillus azoreducens]|uniref:DoxX family protein n=1 Tax=Paenibacillus azoreducens TaxID=116718 RepID=UPI0039F508C9